MCVCFVFLVHVRGQSVGNEKREVFVVKSHAEGFIQMVIIGLAWSYGCEAFLRVFVGVFGY